jgi:hypothetical protein
MPEGSCTYIILGKHVSRVFEDLRKTKAPNSMNACKTFLSLMDSKSVKPILLSSLKLLQKTCLYAKFMLMILYLGQVTSHLVKSLVGSWYGNSRCLWWGSWNISLDFKSSNSKRAPSSAKLSTFKSYLRSLGWRMANPSRHPWEQMGISTSTWEVNS